jgi:hypothetical protein
VRRFSLSCYPLKLEGRLAATECLLLKSRIRNGASLRGTSRAGIPREQKRVRAVQYRRAPNALVLYFYMCCMSIYGLTDLHSLLELER